MQSLQPRFVFWSVVLCAGSAALLGACLLWLSARGLRDQARQGQLALAHSLASQVDLGVSQAYQAVGVLAEQPAIVTLKPALVQHELTLVTSATELLDNLLVLLPDGREVARSHPSVLPEELPQMAAVLGTNSSFQHLDGKVLADLYQTPHNGPAVAIRAPILKQGRVIGIVLGIFYLSQHSIGNLDNTRIGRSGFAFLIDPAGMPLRHPTSSKLLRDLTVSQEVQLSAGKPQNWVSFSTPEGEDFMAAIVRVPSAGWSVVVRQPAKECYEPAAKMLGFMGVFLIVVVLVVGFVSAAVARRLAEPILQLADRVGAMGPMDGTMQDVTSASPERGGELALLQGALRQLGERLKRQVRFREQAHRRALGAERALQQAERLATVGQLAAGVAHELNNPLTVILGAAQEAAVADATRRRHWLGRLSGEVQRCKRLIQELLDFARPVRLEPSEVRLAALCRESWARASLGRRSKARLSLPSRDVACWVDAPRLTQVLVNLFSNAMDASGRQGKVELRWQRLRGRLRLTLRDSGPGIGKQDPEELFRPFYTSKDAGTGLGLPISRAILQAHGGGLSAKSSKDGSLSFVAEFRSLKAANPKRKR